MPAGNGQNHQGIVRSPKSCPSCDSTRTKVIYAIDVSPFPKGWNPQCYRLGKPQKKQEKLWHIRCVLIRSQGFRL